MRLLLIEDDATLGSAIQQGLVEAGNECDWRRNGADGLEAALSQQADVVILDLLLPDLPGMQVLTAMRRQGVRTPVLILSALGSVDDRVGGLQQGADDYLVKPFAFAELLARLQALARRTAESPSKDYRVGALSLDLAVRRVTREGKEIDLTPTEFSLLEFLMRHAGQVITRKMLCEHLWDADWEGVTNVVDVHVSRLRGKIDRGFTPPLLHTVRGRGYVLRAADERVDKAESDAMDDAGETAG
ncbi:Transcriptional regulatory protein CusR [Botrimarina colliarenosi]|uniref:Transcriptional regulatory protein CusR n=1 Tax=Botrimarina colliarenosi TaxID=2528001 RepID=A0A5C6AEU7_9BACT|nr:response regulator transcription factor [Botrimarina colliarenosi]TWT97956.1 Transcriptional regulatory protein CusR [Botrimarina colliarenosi]